MSLFHVIKYQLDKFPTQLQLDAIPKPIRDIFEVRLKGFYNTPDFTTGDLLKQILLEYDEPV